MALKKNILWTIGGPESTPGLAVARTHVIPVRDLPSLDQKAERLVDPVIAGGRMDVSEFMSKLDVSGGLPLSPRVCPGYGKLLKSNFGTESAPVQIGAVVRIRYSGVSASLKLTADASGNTLNAKKGALGSEANDAAFGTAGTLDLTASGVDTVGELVTEIDGYADYQAELVHGAASVSAADIISIITQAKSRWAYLFFTSSTSGVYMRTFSSDLTDTEHSVYSIEREGYISTGTLFDGCVVDQIKHSATLGAMLEADADILGMKELDPATASGLSIDDLEDVDPLLFWKGSTELGGKDFKFISSIGFTSNNNHNKDTYGQSVASRQYHQKSMLNFFGDMQLRLDTDTYDLRANIFTTALKSMSLMFKGKLIAASLYEMLILELPFIGLTSPFDMPDRNGALDAKVNWKAFNPKGTKYDVPVRMHFFSSDSGAF